MPRRLMPMPKEGQNGVALFRPSKRQVCTSNYLPLSNAMLFIVKSRPLKNVSDRRPTALNIKCNCRKPIRTLVLGQTLRQIPPYKPCFPGGNSTIRVKNWVYFVRFVVTRFSFAVSVLNSVNFCLHSWVQLDRFRLVDHIISTRLVMGGAQLDTAKLLNQNSLLGFYALHDAVQYRLSFAPVFVCIQAFIVCLENSFISGQTRLFIEGLGFVAQNFLRPTAGLYQKLLWWGNWTLFCLAQSVHFIPFPARCSWIGIVYLDVTETWARQQGRLQYSNIAFRIDLRILVSSIFKSLGEEKCVSVRAMGHDQLHVHMYNYSVSTNNVNRKSLRHH